MSILSAVTPIIGGVIDKLIPDPAAKAKAQLELAVMQQNGELKELETRMSAILAEANSTDPWTSRARPSFMYVFYFIIIMMTVVLPIVGIFNPEAMTQFYAHSKAGFDAIPEDLWWAFTAGYLGYSGARTYEKRKGVAK